MANEITVTHQVRVQNGTMIFDTGGESFTPTQVTKAFSAGVQVIGTTHEQIVIASDVATAGVSWFKNISTANFIELGLLVSGTFYPFAKIPAGESYPIRLGTNTIYAKADTAACSLQHLILAA